MKNLCNILSSIFNVQQNFEKSRFLLPATMRGVHRLERLPQNWNIKGIIILFVENAKHLRVRSREMKSGTAYSIILVAQFMSRESKETLSCFLIKLNGLMRVDM